MYTYIYTHTCICVCIHSQSVYALSLQSCPPGQPPPPRPGVMGHRPNQNPKPPNESSRAPTLKFSVIRQNESNDESCFPVGPPTCTGDRLPPGSCRRFLPQTGHAGARNAIQNNIAKCNLISNREMQSKKNNREMQSTI